MKNGFAYILFFLLLPFFSFAHGSHGSGFIAGLTHPIFGMDHNLAILGVGFLGALMDKMRWYFYPLAFWIPMAIGGILGVGNEASPMLESLIAISVIFIGAFISFKSDNFKYLLLGLIAIFGYFHGFAHGAEMPETTTIVKYISGFSSGTILLSIIGYLMHNVSSKLKISEALIQTFGGFLIGAGTIFLIG